MKTPTNQQRTALARTVLGEYLRHANRLPDTLECNITDLVTDLLHLANRHDIDPARITRISYDHFIAEHNERARKARQHGRSIKHEPLDLMKYVRAQYEHDKNLPDAGAA